MKNIINNFREYQIELNQAELTIKTYCEYIENFVNEYDITVENLEKISNSDFVKQWLKSARWRPAVWPYCRFPAWMSQQMLACY